MTPAIKCEAMRLARNDVKAILRSRKIKITHLHPREITKVAKVLIDAFDPYYQTEAEANLQRKH